MRNLLRARPLSSGAAANGYNPRAQAYNETARAFRPTSSARCGAFSSAPLFGAADTAGFFRRTLTDCQQGGAYEAKHSPPRRRPALAAGLTLACGLPAAAAAQTRTPARRSLDTADILSKNTENYITDLSVALQESCGGADRRVYRR